MHPDPRSLFVNIIRHHANNMQKKKKKNVPMTDIHKTTWAWRLSDVEEGKQGKPNAFD